MKKFRSMFRNSEISHSPPPPAEVLPAKAIELEPKITSHYRIETLLLNLAINPSLADCIEAVGDYYSELGNKEAAVVLYQKAKDGLEPSVDRIQSKIMSLRAEDENARRLATKDLQTLIPTNDQIFLNGLRQFLVE